MACRIPKVLMLPLIIALSASVPPDVKRISPGVQFNNSAIFFLEDSIAALTLRPCEWVEDGFPKSSSIKGLMASKTSGSSGVVAALSKYTFIRARKVQKREDQIRAKITCLHIQKKNKMATNETKQSF
jgi:hypothetical protein